MELKAHQRLAIPIVMLFISLSVHICQGGDTIKANQSLSGDESLISSDEKFKLGFSNQGANTITVKQSLSGDKSLISSNEKFKLGFFKPGNSSYYYIGIWYNKVSVQTVVWVANRDNPIKDKSSNELKILDGNLVLINDSKAPAWSTNLASPGTGSMVATLTDDGNFVLKGGSNSFHTLWQSFDHPSDTWLPGGKLGRNKRTNETQILTSWKSENDPATGLFSLQMQPSNEFFILWNMSYPYWTSGKWIPKDNYFTFVPEMRPQHIFYYNYIDNERESYFTYEFYNKSFISRIIMDLSGHLQQLAWLESSQQWNSIFTKPKGQCEVHNVCGPFGICSESTNNFCSCLPGFSPSSQSDWNLSDYSHGCKRNMALQCGLNHSGAEKDRFLSIDHIGKPSNEIILSAEGAKGCKIFCSNNCSCTAYSYENGQCSIWSGDLLNAQKESGNSSVFLRLSASDFPNSSEGNVRTTIAGSIGGATAMLVIILLGIWIWKRKAGTAKMIEGSLMAFSNKDLKVATKNFSEKLGGGGFGSVFKGTLPDSKDIAVKKLESISQGKKQFCMEVSTIGTIQHVNLVKLLGFCSRGNTKMLVYEYMPNGSLDFHLFNKKETKVLDWKARHQIALGIARGLAYLHEKCRDRIIHCDIKPENILLDAKFCPKVADFGLAKIVGREFSRVLTTIRGTRGYLAPEWIRGAAITAKADVYSYGMMLFEIISGRRNFEQFKDVTTEFFPTWAASKIAGGEDLTNLLDPKLEKEADKEELEKLCKVACWCIQDDENYRPSMGQVVQILEGLLDVNLPPIPSFFQALHGNQEYVLFSMESSLSPGSETKKQ